MPRAEIKQLHTHEVSIDSQRYTLITWVSGWGRSCRYEATILTNGVATAPKRCHAASARLALLSLCARLAAWQAPVAWASIPQQPQKGEKQLWQ